MPNVHFHAVFCTISVFVPVFDVSLKFPPDVFFERFLGKANAAEADPFAIVQPWRSLRSRNCWHEVATPDAKAAHWEDLVGACSSFSSGTRQVKLEVVGHAGHCERDLTLTSQR